jgi:5'-nucleotidase
VKLNILLTNDDGIQASGLWALFEALRNEHDVVVVAPDRERSAVGHGITLHQPLRAIPMTVHNGYSGRAVNGTPADCVKLALAELLENRPDIVISGINPGANVGINLSYSGTVAAAREASMNGVCALAVSIQGYKDHHFDAAAAFVNEIVADMPGMDLPKGTFLNINVPNLPRHRIQGVRISRQSVDPYTDIYEKRKDPRKRSYYWPHYDSQPAYQHPDADGALLSADFISITPVQCDTTDYRTLQRLKNRYLESDGNTSVAI